VCVCGSVCEEVMLLQYEQGVGNRKLMGERDNAQLRSLY